MARTTTKAKGRSKFLLADSKKAPLKHLWNAQSEWTVRDDVWVRYKRENGPLLVGPLSIGFSVYGGKHHFGPELQFGHVIGDVVSNQVLIIKTAWGGKSLYKDFRPPSRRRRSRALLHEDDRRCSRSPGNLEDRLSELCRGRL